MTLLASKYPVIFAGENHMITLHLAGTQTPILSASCWRCTYSEHGEGFVLLIWHDPAQSGLAQLPPDVIYADNAAMARMVAERFGQYFEGFRGRGVATREPVPARFVQQGDGRRSHRIACMAGEITIELVWREMLDTNLEIFYNTSGPIPYDVSAVICHCAHGAIQVNGAPSQGEVHQPAGETYSSAFLAFSETWVQAAAQAAVQAAPELEQARSE